MFMMLDAAGDAVVLAAKVLAVIIGVPLIWYLGYQVFSSFNIQ